MKTKTSLLLMTVVTTLGLSGPAVAAHLDAPEGLVCDRAFDNSVHSKWKDRDGASYYSVDVTAEYDVSGNGQTDRSHDFHFGSRESELMLESGDLRGSFVDDDGKVVDKMPMTANIRVKAVHLGKGHEKDKVRNNSTAAYSQSRNADFTECTVTFAAPAACRGFCR